MAIVANSEFVGDFLSMFRILLFMERLSITFPVWAERQKEETISTAADKKVLFILQ